MNKFFKILEITWLITAILCACISVYFLITKETDSALYFIFVFIIAGIMYLLRKHQRTTQEKVNAHNTQFKKK